MEKLKDVEKKFYKYSTELESFIETNKEHYEKDEYSRDGEFSQSLNLFETNMVRMEGVHDDEWIPLFGDTNIKYFIFENYWDSDGQQREFHVYENGEFRPANGEEDDYLRNVEDEYEILYYGDQDPLSSFTDEDWFRMKNKQIDAFKTFNEKVSNRKTIKSWKQFNENLEDGYSKEFDKKWEEVVSLSSNILQLTDQYTEEELHLMGEIELRIILGELMMKNDNE